MTPTFFKTRRGRLLLLLTGCALTALLLALWPRDRVPEPRYAGKSFSEWLALYSESATRPGLQGRAEAVHALREIGTNALPFLLRLVQHETPAWKTFLGKIAPKLPSAIQSSRLFSRLQQDKAEQQADTAIIAFDVLGSQAVSAGTELIRLANDKKRTQTARRAWLCAAIVGKSLPTDAPFALDSQKPIPRYPVIGTNYTILATNSSGFIIFPLK
jgi:hypothetical protein